MDMGSADVKRGVTRAWLAVMASGAMMGGCGGDDGGVQATASETDPTETASSSGSSTDPDPSTTVTDSGSSSSSGSTGGSSSSSGGSSESSTGTGSGSESGSGSSSGGAEASSSGSGSSGGSSSGVAAESSSGTDPSIGFIEDPDVPLQFECSPWEQDCPDGEKCMPWANDGGNSWNALTCTPLDPTPAAVGDACTVEGSGVSGIDDCDVGAMCWAVDPETNQGTCVAFCTGSPDMPVCADPTTQCTIENGGVLILCLPSCDPLLQDCAEGDECIPSNDTFVCVVDSSDDFGGAGDACEYINVCDPGLMCADAALVPNCNGSIGCCTPFCDVTDAGASMDCANAIGIEAECLAFFEEGQAPPGYEDVGVCGIPS